MDDKGRSDGFLKGLVLGTLAGAGLFCFLNMTEEGKKTKRRIKEQAKDALDNLTEIIGEFEEKGEKFSHKAKELQEELDQKTREVGNRVAQQAQKGFSRIEKLRERGRKAAKFFTRNGRPVKKTSLA